MTKEEWDKAEQELSFSFGRVKLQIDEYKADLVIEPYKKMRNCIAVYVDGKIKGEYITKDCEIRRRFYQRHSKNACNVNSKKLKKESKEVQKAVKDFNEKYKYEWFEPWWTSFAAMKRHFIKNNKSIELRGEEE